MKKFIYWLMGENAGKITVNTWNWLLGIPAESGGNMPEEAARESLRTMQESVEKLAQAVSIQVAAYERTKEKYKAKLTELQGLENEAMMAQRNGNQEAARLAMSKAIQVEQLMPMLEEQVKQAEEYVNASQDKLNREQMKLEAYKIELQNMQDMAEVNEALLSIAEVNNKFNIDSARSQFEAAKEAIQQRNLQKKTLAELSEDPNEKFQADIDKMTLDEEVSRRLQQLEGKHSKQLPE